VLSTTSGPPVVAAVFCLVFLVMGSAFSFSTFASDLGRELKAGSGSISFIFCCAMTLLYAGGLFSGALADRIGTHRIAGAGALLAGGSLVAVGAVGRVWEADLTLGLGFGLSLAVCYTPAVARRATLVRPQSRGCVGNRLVGYRARYALDAADCEMADR
jgi:MFS family permease